MIRKTIASVMIITVLVSANLFPFAFDIVKAIGLLKKVSAHIEKYSGKIDEYYQKFNEFYKKNWEKYYGKFTKSESLKTGEWISGNFYKKQYVDNEKMEEKWKRIFGNPKTLSKIFPYLYSSEFYKDNHYYKENRKVRRNINKGINDEKDYLKNIEEIITLISNTRRSQKIRYRKIGEFKRYIKNFSKPSGHGEVRMGRLLGLSAILDIEIERQFVEMISLLNAETELEIKSSVMHENMKRRNRTIRNKVNLIKNNR